MKRSLRFQLATGLLGLTTTLLPLFAQDTALVPPATKPEELTGTPNSVPSTLFSFRAENVPIKQALVLFAHANGLNVVPDLDVEGDVTVDFADLPLDLAMSALLESNGYYFTQQGKLLRVRNQESRLFQIDYINMTRSGNGSNGVQITSGGGSSGGSGGSASSGGSSEGSSMTVTNTSTINFWGDLKDQLKTLVSEKGSFTINSLAGTVLVRDSHRNVNTISDFIRSVTANVVRQIDLEVEIYEVALSDSTQLGINWQRLESTISGSPTLVATNIPGQLGLGSAAGLIIQNPVFGTPPPSPGVRVGLTRGNTSAVLDALRQQGNLKVVSKPRLRTLNNQPAVVRVGQDIPIFIRTVTQQAGTPPLVTVTESVQTVTVGTVLSITPQISADGLVTLDVTPAVSRLVRTESSASGDTNAPVIDIRQASSIVRLRDGDTIVMGGLVQDSTSTTRRKIPILSEIPLLGKAFTGKYDTSERNELIFFLTPRIIQDGAVEKALKTAAK